MADTDQELLGRVGLGEQAALTELYTRHWRAALKVARTYSRHRDPEALVAQAFANVLGAIRRGNGPTDAFRAYLLVTLRRVAATEATTRDEVPLDDDDSIGAVDSTALLDHEDRALATRAYESLHGRWQVVLWHTVVDGRPPREVAAMLGITPNAAAALAYRAREMLRQAYLQAHLQTARPQCEPHRSRLGAYVRNGLSRRDRTATERHLDECGQCRALVAELREVDRFLPQTKEPFT